LAIHAKEGRAAQKITVEMADDLDGSQADTTVRFAVDGTVYEIDLSKKNAAKMRRDFGRYIEHARRATGGRRSGRPRRERDHSSAVREWAKQQGIQVSDRGRIPTSVVSQYEKAHG
jgi:Lsr2